MKVRKYKNGAIKMTAENKKDSGDLLNFLAACAGEDSHFAKVGKKKVCPYCNSTDIIMFDADDDICNKCRRYYPGT